MTDKVLEEIKEYWNYNGEHNEIDDIKDLRDVARNDIFCLISEIKRLKGEEKQ